MKNKIAFLLMAGVVGGCTAVQPAVEVGPLGDAAVGYVPVSRSMEVTAGQLVLSSGMASFKERKGTMLLRYAKTLGEDDVAQDSWFGGVGGPKVYLYQVLNDDLYYRANAGRNGMCGKPVKWLALSPKENGDMSLCEVTDEGGSLAPDKPTVCGCGVYMKQSK